jgi:cell division protein FtsL
MRNVRTFPKRQVKITSQKKSVKISQMSRAVSIFDSDMRTNTKPHRILDAAVKNVWILKRNNSHYTVPHNEP